MTELSSNPCTLSQSSRKSCVLVESNGVYYVCEMDAKKLAGS